MASKSKDPTGKVPVPNMKRGVKAFVQDVVKEMHRVIWPSRAETVRLTSAVLIVCLLFVLYLWAAGYIVNFIMRAIEGGGPS